MRKGDILKLWVTRITLDTFPSLLAEGKAHIALLQKDQKIDLRYGWFSL